ncbi:unnamed protein product [Arctogadus glacialis]
MIVDMADQSWHWLCGEVPYCMEHVCGMDSVMIHLIIHRREERNTLQNISSAIVMISSNTDKQKNIKFCFIARFPPSSCSVPAALSVVSTKRLLHFKYKIYRPY